MDRDAIERRDFPIGRRGYDQAAVDAHLRRVADELEALRASGERLNQGLARLQEQAGELGAAAGGVPAPEEDFAAASPADAQDGGAATDAPGDDEAGARLIALNMALSGTPREETARYLAEHFALADADALLDDVYERADR